MVAVLGVAMAAVVLTIRRERNAERDKEKRDRYKFRSGTAPIGDCSDRGLLRSGTVPSEGLSPFLILSEAVLR
jgi:hypothetical protein